MMPRAGPRSCSPMLANVCGRAATSQPQTRAVAVSERVYFGGRATASALMISKPAATSSRIRRGQALPEALGGVAVNGL
jgi:hypothetical protein